MPFDFLDDDATTLAFEAPETTDAVVFAPPAGGETLWSAGEDAALLDAAFAEGALQLETPETVAAFRESAAALDAALETAQRRLMDVVEAAGDALGVARDADAVRMLLSLRAEALSVWSGLSTANATFDALEASLAPTPAAAFGPSGGELDLARAQMRIAVDLIGDLGRVQTLADRVLGSGGAQAGALAAADWFLGEAEDDLFKAYVQALTATASSAPAP